MNLSPHFVSVAVVVVPFFFVYLSNDNAKNEMGSRISTLGVVRLRVALR